MTPVSVTSPLDTWEPFSEHQIAVMADMRHPAPVIRALRQWGGQVGTHTAAGVVYDREPDDKRLIVSLTTTEQDAATITIDADGLRLSIGNAEDGYENTVPASEIFELGAFDAWANIVGLD